MSEIKVLYSLWNDVVNAPDGDMKLYELSNLENYTLRTTLHPMDVDEVPSALKLIRLVREAEKEEEEGDIYERIADELRETLTDWIYEF